MQTPDRSAASTSDRGDGDFTLAQPCGVRAESACAGNGSRGSEEGRVRQYGYDSRGTSDRAAASSERLEAREGRPRADAGPSPQRSLSGERSAAPKCKPGKCAYDNFACPNGCKEEVELDIPARSAAQVCDCCRRIVASGHVCDGDPRSTCSLYGCGRPVAETRLCGPDDVDASAGVKDLCGFCKGEPVFDAAEWLDGVHLPPAPCPRCGETNTRTPSPVRLEDVPAHKERD